LKPSRLVVVLALAASSVLAQTPAPAAATAAAPAAAPGWALDKAHSQVEFRIRHLMGAVTGKFKTLDANFNIDKANPAASSVDFTIQTTSIDTGNSDRDDHLRSGDFFDVAKYPTIKFKSTSIKSTGKDTYAVTGDFTMKDVTKRITLPVTVLGFMTDARGNERVGFELETTLNRKDYNVLWNRTLDDGGVLLGDDVKVTINLEVRKAAAK